MASTSVSLHLGSKNTVVTLRWDDQLTFSEHIKAITQVCSIMALNSRKQKKNMFVCVCVCDFNFLINLFSDYRGSGYCSRL